MLWSSDFGGAEVHTERPPWEQLGVGGWHNQATGKGSTEQGHLNQIVRDEWELVGRAAVPGQEVQYWQSLEMGKSTAWSGRRRSGG